MNKFLLSSVALVALCSSSAADDALQERIAKLEAAQQAQIESQERIKSELESLKNISEENASPILSEVPSPQTKLPEKEGYFIIPGTDSYMKIFGFAKLVVLYDTLGKGRGYCQNLFFGPQLALEPDTDYKLKNQFNTSVRESRLDVEVLAPFRFADKNKEFKVLIEGDFLCNPAHANEDISDSYYFRIRKAYGELGPVLIGQNHTVFFDEGCLPETVDFLSSVGQTVVRQPQVRYTHEVNDEVKLVAAIENPESEYVKKDGSSNFTTKDVMNQTVCFDKMPDFTAAAFYKKPTWHLSVHGLYRGIWLKNSTGKEVTTSGTSVGFSGAYEFLKHDKLTFFMGYGKAAGRYLEDSYLQAAYYDGGDNLYPIASKNICVGIKHAWIPSINLRSTVAIGYLRLMNHSDLQKYIPTNSVTGINSINKSFNSFHVNLFWSPVKNADLGVEYVDGARHVEGGVKGYLHRIMIGGKLSF